MINIVRNDFIDKREFLLSLSPLRNSSILITGATGMLASYFVLLLKLLNKEFDYNIKIYALFRNKIYGETLFGKEEFGIKYIIQDVRDPIIIEDDLDYVFHAAGHASPYHISHQPVEIIQANIQGTLNLLESIKERGVKKVIFTSTREIYGNVSESISRIKETDMGMINPLEPRSCYPESKRMAETILQSYYKQYNIPFITARIAHVYGPGMRLNNDGRVMADLLKYAMLNEDIILRSDGSALRSFCYISDAIEAVFSLLLKANVGEAYNISNEYEEISILELANLILKLSGSNNKVVFDIENDNQAYCSYKRVGLDTSKIEKLDWKPTTAITEGIKRTLSYFYQIKND